MTEEEFRRKLAPDLWTADEAQYHATETQLRFMSNSQYGNWLECPARTLAELKGEWREADSAALFFGKYFHTYFEGETAFQRFTEANRDKIYKKNGEPYAMFQHAEAMFAKVRNDPKAVCFTSGYHEVTITGTIAGVLWRGKIDVLDPQLRFFTDLKSVDDIYKGEWVTADEDGDRRSRKVSFIRARNYWRQMAVYRHLLAQLTGKSVSPLMVAVSKQAFPDIELIGFNTARLLELEITRIEAAMPEIMDMKAGRLPPKHCGRCDYCRSVKRIRHMIPATEIIPLD